MTNHDPQARERAQQRSEQFFGGRCICSQAECAINANIDKLAQVLLRVEAEAQLAEAVWWREMLASGDVYPSEAGDKRLAELRSQAGAEGGSK